MPFKFQIEVPENKENVLFLNAILMIYAEQRAVRGKLSELLAQKIPNQTTEQIDAYYSGVAEDFFNDAWVSLLQKFGE